jgi:hypothetical protein
MINRFLTLACTVFCAAVFLVLKSCKNGPDLNSRDTTLKGTTADTVVLTEKALLFFQPDTLHFQRIEAKMKDSNFEKNVGDCRQNTSTLRAKMFDTYPELKQLDNHGARYLLCIRADKSRICIDMNAPWELCAVYAFQPAKDPLPVELNNAEAEIEAYLSNQTSATSRR